MRVGPVRSSDRRRLPECLLNLPTLALRERAMFDDPNLVALGAGVGLVMSHEPRIAADVLLVSLVLHETFDTHHDGLVHLVADHGTDQCSSNASFADAFAHLPASRF